MSLKYARENGRKKIHPVKGIGLLFISLTLVLITTPFGLIYGFFYKFIQGSVKGFGEYCLRMAIALDQLGNVIMQHLFNSLLIIKGGYKFGNRDETISSALGKNVDSNTLSKTGKFLNAILDSLDHNHSLNSIDHYIEPVENAYKE